MNRALIFGALCVLLVSTSAQEVEDHPPPPTDAEIKKMKIKQLKAFIADRGLTCDDCFEKGDYVKFVKANRAAQLLPSKRKRKVSKEPIHDQWKKVAEDVCLEMKCEEKLAKNFAKVVSGSFEMHGRRVSKQLHKEPHLMAKTSMEDPFLPAMMKTFKQTIASAQKKGIVKQDPLRKKLDDEIKMFLTAVGADNVNPMYEKLNAKDDEEL